jgi:ABC-type glycerol-3-phosphate transport system substrate-binding protein
MHYIMAKHGKQENNYSPLSLELQQGGRQMVRKEISGLRRAGIMALSCLLIVCLTMGMTVGASAKKKLRIITEESAPEAVAWLDSVIEDFQKIHPDVEISPEYIGFDEFYPKLMAQLAAGDPPQVMKVEVNEAFELQFEGLLEPLTEIINAWPMGRADFLENALLKRGGEDYFFPTETSAHSLYYRKDWLAEAGMERPLTWDEWVDAAEAMTKDVDGDGKTDRWGEIIPMARSRSAAGMFYDELWINGGTFFAQGRTGKNRTGAYHHRFAPDQRNPEAHEKTLSVLSSRVPHLFLE